LVTLLSPHLPSSPVSEVHDFTLPWQERSGVEEVVSREEEEEMG